MGAAVTAVQSRYDSAIDRKWQCHCGAFVGAERHQREIEPTAPRMPNRAYHKAPFSQKVVETWYTPASRYWNDKTVHCGPDCAINFQKAGEQKP